MKSIYYSMKNEVFLLKSKIFFGPVIMILSFVSCNHSNEQTITTGLQNLYLTSNADSRSISPENLTGEKGKGGMISPKEGNAKKASIKHGWKTNPYIFIMPGETTVLAEAEGPGIINHIWLTTARDDSDRLRILRFYWDNEIEPSVEVPLCDFFCNAWDNKNQSTINSLPVVVNPLNGFNSFWQMPFRKKFKITLENRAESRSRLFYSVDYTLTSVLNNAAYFHAQFRTVKKVPFKEEFTIIDNIKGRGQYIGTFLAHATKSNKWWGEGEVKFFIDSDTDFPTINGTGEEDYFLGSWGYSTFNDDGTRNLYTDYNTPYAGFFQVKPTSEFLGRFSQYRWHIYDPIRFKTNFKMSIQCLGWDNDGNYLPLEDMLSSVAFWYQTEPHLKFPEFPVNEKLIVHND
jgi:hypothetical protein